MAAPLLIYSGRIAAFKLQAWGLRSLRSAVSFSTKPGDSKKGSKKNKGEIIINTKPAAAVKRKDEDLRKSLAKKTVVTFPQRAKFPSLEGQSVFSSTGGLSKKKADGETSSSSSSESDSSSDSEEDNAFKDTIKTKISFPSRDPLASENRTKKTKITREKHFSQEQIKDKAPEKSPCSPGFTETPIQQKELHRTTGGDKWLRSDLSKRATKQRYEETHLKSTGLGTKVAESQKPTEVTAKHLEASLPEATSSTLSRIQSGPPQSVAQNLTLLRQEENVARETQKAEMQGRTAAELQGEDLEGRMPVAETTVKEETVLEAGAQTEQHSTIQEATPSAETAQEVFDISTYKNLQHHEYTPYTFVDYDVQLSKFRLPQPSSGRLSP
ncbi:NADH dehydrogenase [ubiquinone] flavoprotein 3, mitochondrial [Rhineura floridana]|uniref:NADH dehydrogenase [ubiquinone] flavoprotein 3, mitochondrial n=1 Tax=Rhineura floridana TaxID=261503 RepID=UPI002AC7F80D|nr:NADH dehydrogenase [ubiquinone] flavoprotein 3, mitochondrial [Rhineura floridana]